MSDLKTYTHGPRSGDKPRQMVMLLHGLGANGMDLIGLAQYWESILPDAVFVSPDAPFPCDMAPVGHQWFSLQEWTPESILKGVEAVAPTLNEYIDKMLQHYDIEEENMVLGGFSQGTMMSLYTGIRRSKKIAGILGYSGALIGEDKLGSADIQKPPVHLIHGEADPVVPIEAYHHAKSALDQNGFQVSGYTQPGLQHGIDERGIQSGGAFLKECLEKI